MIFNNKKLNALIIGLGSISLRHRKNLKLLCPNIHIIGLPSSGKIENKDTDLIDEVILSIDEIKKKIDFAIIASPSTFHFKYLKILFSERIPCLIEKPLAHNLHDAEQIMDIYNKTNIPACVGYCLRYMPSAIKMKEILDQKVLGKIYNVFVNVGQYLPDWRPSKNYQNTVSAKKFLGGGALLELSHEIDYIQWLFGSLKVKYAKLRTSKELNLDVEDLGDIIFESNKENILCNLHLDFLQKKPQRTCSIIGEKGRIDWDLIKNTIKFHDKKNSEYLFFEKKWDNNNMYIDLLKNFINSIKYQNINIPDLKQSLKVMELIDDIKFLSKKDTSQ